MPKNGKPGCRRYCLSPKRRAHDVRSHRRHEALTRHVERVFDTSRKDTHALGEAEIKEGSMKDGRHLLVIVAW
jgi:hypothetical protein